MKKTEGLYPDQTIFQYLLPFTNERYYLSSLVSVQPKQKLHPKVVNTNSTSVQVLIGFSVQDCHELLFAMIFTFLNIMISFVSGVGSDGYSGAIFE